MATLEVVKKPEPITVLPEDKKPSQEELNAKAETLFKDDLKKWEMDISALQGDEKTAKEKDLKKIKHRIAGLRQLIKMGADPTNANYLAEVQVVEDLFSGKKTTKTNPRLSVEEKISKMFGKGTMVYSKTLLIVSEKEIPDELILGDYRTFAKDFDKTAINYKFDGNPEITTRGTKDGKTIIELHRDKIPTDTPVETPVETPETPVQK
jgi:hypothetical protein